MQQCEKAKQAQPLCYTLSHHHLPSPFIKENASADHSPQPARCQSLHDLTKQ